MSQPQDESAMAAQAVAQLFSMAKQEMTPVESTLWLQQIGKFGPQTMLAFVAFWASGAGQGSYLRAPLVEDFLLRADPMHVGPQTVMAQLYDLVVNCGPYTAPTTKNMKLQSVIVSLGGWVKVCEDMPIPTDDFAWKNYEQRVKTALLQSEAKQVQLLLQPANLLGLSGTDFSRKSNNQAFIP